MPDKKETSNSIDVETLFQKFEELADQANEGKEIVITKDNQPIAKLVPI